MSVDALPALTDEQREAVLQVFRDASADGQIIGNVEALRRAGIEGKRTQLRALIDDDLKAEIREARGWSVDKAKQMLYEAAIDKEHKSFLAANQAFLKAYGGSEFRDVSRHELTGKDGGPMQLIAGRFDPDQLTLEELETLRELAAKATPKELDGGDA